jgi:hypothetical protein
MPLFIDRLPFHLWTDTLEWPVKSFDFGPYYLNRAGQFRNRVYWTQPGEYAVRAVLYTADGEGRDNFTPVGVYSNWVKLKVVEKR